MTSTTLLSIILAFVIFEFLFDKLLNFFNAKSWDQATPEIVKGLYDEEKYAKAKNYAKANGKLALISGGFNFILVLLVLVFKGFAGLDVLVKELTSNKIGQTLLFFGILSLITSIINLPFGVYKTFVIEEKFGFNKTDAKTFIIDKIKGLILGALIGGLLLSVLTWVYYAMPNEFWWIAWLIMTAFSLFFATFYTTLIVPIFNKLTPLEEGSLRTSIETYANKVDFPLTNIFVIDGSKRSSKANAFFSGFGRKKAIVLYDTLMEDNTEEELTAILAHEVGHYKKNHIKQSMILGILQTGILLFLFGLLSKSEVLAGAFGVADNSFYISLIGFSLLYTPISLIIGILMNMFSRKNEFEADAYAKETYDGEPLQSALKKLSVNHLSNLTPDSRYVFVHYSHPPLVERLKALRK